MSKVHNIVSLLLNTYTIYIYIHTHYKWTQLSNFELHDNGDRRLHAMTMDVKVRNNEELGKTHGASEHNIYIGYWKLNQS